MLLYSTILNIRSSFTKEDFVRLVIEWNQSQADRHPQNVIPGIQWNGKIEGFYRNDDDTLSLEIIEYRNKNIVAVRYEKKADDGAIWDTDYVLNFDEMRLAIRLDRTFTEGAQMERMPFSTPQFVSFLIRDNWLEDDNGLSIQETPILLTTDNMDALASAAHGEHRFHLPVVYISRTTENEPPADVEKLCKRLKGAAHVIVEADIDQNDAVREACGRRTAIAGDVAIYYPNGKASHLAYRFFVRFAARLDNLHFSVEGPVFRYNNLQDTPVLYTWWGVRVSLLSDRLQSNREERQQAEDDLSTYIQEFDPQYKRLDAEYRDVVGRLTAMEQENLSLRARLNNGDKEPLLYRGEEDDLYPDEVREVVLAVIESKAKESDNGSRRSDVLKDIVAHNEYHHEVSARRQKIKDLKVGTGKLSSAQRSELERLGIVIASDKNHYKLNLNGDARYMVTMAKTGSDTGSGSENTAAQINRTMF